VTRKQIRSLIRNYLIGLTNNTDEVGTQSRYPDTFLNSLIDEASKRFLEKTELLEGNETVAVDNGSGTITGAVIKIKRIEISGEPIGWVYTDAYDEDLPALD